MQRITCPERDDWRATAEACGFDFHSVGGERYWDERGYYAFTLEEIEANRWQPTVRECTFSLTEFNGDIYGTNAKLMELINGR